MIPCSLWQLDLDLATWVPIFSKLHLYLYLPGSSVGLCTCSVREPAKADRQTGSVAPGGEKPISMRLAILNLNQADTVEIRTHQSKATRKFLQPGKKRNQQRASVSRSWVHAPVYSHPEVDPDPEGESRGGIETTLVSHTYLSEGDVDVDWEGALALHCVESR